MGTLTQNIPTPLENKITNNLIYSETEQVEEIEEDAVSYFSDNSTQSSDTFDHQDYVAAVDPLENSHKTVYNDNVGCIIEVKTDDELDEDTSDADSDIHQYHHHQQQHSNNVSDNDSDTSSDDYSDTNEYEEPFQMQNDEEEEVETYNSIGNSISLNNNQQQQPLSPSTSPSSIEEDKNSDQFLFDRSPSVDTDATTPLSKGTEFNLDNGQNYNNNNHYPLINKDVVINHQQEVEKEKKNNNNGFIDEDYNSIDLENKNNNMSNNNYNNHSSLSSSSSSSSSNDNISNNNNNNNNNNNRNTLRLSAVSFSELNEISLSEDTTATTNNSDTTTTTTTKSSKDSIIAVATNVISNVSSAVANSVKSPTSSIFGDHFNNKKNSTDNDRSISTNSIDQSSTRSSLPPLPPPPPVPEKDKSISKPTPINTNDLQSSSSRNSKDAAPMMTPSKSTPTQRFVSGLWSTLKTSTTPSSTSSTSSTTTSSSSSISSSSSSNVAKKKIQRPSDSFTKRQSRPPSCVLPGFQESLLAQMEQLNSENKNDPKAQRLLNLKRQSIRKSLVKVSTETPNSNDYDWEFWTTVICEFDHMKKSKEFNNQIRKGIPPSLRGMIWQSLANVNQLNLKEGQQYIELLKTTSPYEKMIQRDLARSFPDHDYFKDKNGVGQEGLYNVVRAYSVYDTEVGYCQGLNFIVGPLLLNMPDEEAFSVLVQLMNHPHYGLRGHFTPTMEGLHLKLYQFNALVADYLPHVSRHLQRRGIDPTMYASQWFMTLFAYKFPLAIVFRIYDIIFTEGTEAIFKFSLALLKKNEAHILELDFEHLLHFLKNGLFEEYIKKKQNNNNDDDSDDKDKEEDDKNCQQLVHDACQWEIPRKRLIQLEKEHKQQTLKEEQDAKLLESLQKQQTQLQQQVDEMNQSIETSKKEHQDFYHQLQDSQQQYQHMKDEQGSLQTVVTSLKQEVDTITPKIENQYKEQFDQLCDENTNLNERNAQLEDQLSSLEAILIDMKMRYAQSENERDELSKKFYELKKIFGQ